MEENKFDKIVGKFFSVFEAIENRIGKFLSWVLFQFFTYLYFVGLFLNSIWEFVVLEDSNFTFESLSFRNLILYGIVTVGYSFVFVGQIKRLTDIDLKFLKFSQKFYSEETTRLCFEPLIADWKTEYSSAVSQNLNWKASWISIRYSYAFVSAMFMNSRVGKLLQIIFKS